MEGWPSWESVRLRFSASTVLLRVAICCYQHGNLCASPACCQHLASDKSTVVFFIQRHKTVLAFSQSQSRCVFCHEGGECSFARSTCRQIAVCAEKAYLLAISCGQQCLEMPLRLETDSSRQSLCPEGTGKQIYKEEEKMERYNLTFYTQSTAKGHIRAKQNVFLQLPQVQF